MQLRGLVLGSQGGEGLESNAWEHRLQRGCDFTLCGSLLPGLVARTHNQKVEYLAIERGECLNIVTRFEPRVRYLFDERPFPDVDLFSGLLQALSLLHSRHVKAYLHLDHLK